MAERIVVGVNDSGPSNAALRWAHERGLATGATVVSEHADPEAGSPVLALINAARTHDLLVVGTHKTGYIHGRVLGTLGIEVAAHAQCSVAIIPENNLTGRGGIVVGVKDAQASRRAIIAGAREALRLRQDLTLLHAADSSEDAHAARELLASAVKVASDAAPGIAIRSRVSRRQRSEALLDASRAATLLVIDGGADGESGSQYLSPVTHEVLLNINSPVIIAR